MHPRLLRSRYPPSHTQQRPPLSTRLRISGPFTPSISLSPTLMARG
jgi:hypothetical protein